MGPRPMPEAEVEVGPELASALLAAQHPDLVAPVRVVAQGWDNVVLRLGEDLALRLPRRALGAQLVATEATWVPLLAPRLPLEVPLPVRRGSPEPALGYPFPWTVVRWVDGATLLGPGGELDEPATVDALARFLAALWAVDVPDGPGPAPHNPWRGVPLAERSDALRERLGRLPSDVDRGAVERAWARALACPSDAGPARWVHGDLHPGNLVAREGRLVGVLDWGDLTVGDRACDLAVAWMVLGPGGRTALRRRLDVDAAGWGRARGNALAHAVAVLAHSADAPAMAAMARRTLTAAVVDQG